MISIACLVVRELGLVREHFKQKCSRTPNSITTYEQQKLGLSAYYDKRWVLEDGIHTEPIEFHC